MQQPVNGWITHWSPSHFVCHRDENIIQDSILRRRGMFMSNPLVSILTPTYNHERFISACIESVLSQSYSNWEMIIVDDDSQDRTPDVVALYNDPRIRYFRQERKGLLKLDETYNFALQQSRGDLVAILPGDDCWTRERLEIQVPLFQDREVVLCFGRYRIIDPDGRFLDRPSPASFKIHVLNRPMGTVIKDMLLRRLPLHPTTFIITHEALARIGGFHLHSLEELPTWLRLAWEGEFRYIDGHLGYWRRHPNQATAGLPTIEGGQAYVKYMADYLDTLTDDQRRIVALDVHKVIRWWGAHANFGIGRRLVLRGDRKNAMRHFLRALRTGGLQTKAAAILGIVAAATKHDLIEQVAQLSGRPPILK
jgi:glycosyltransferase involved in cell wall biosynthesis